MVPTMAMGSWVRGKSSLVAFDSPIARTIEGVISPIMAFASRTAIGPDYYIHLCRAVADRIFTRRTPVCSRFHHLRSCNGVCSQRPHLGVLAVNFFYPLYNGGPDTATLSIYDSNSDQGTFLHEGLSTSSLQTDAPDSEKLVIPDQEKLTRPGLHPEVEHGHSSGINSPFIPLCRQSVRQYTSCRAIRKRPVPALPCIRRGLKLRLSRIPFACPAPVPGYYFFASIFSMEQADL